MITYPLGLRGDISGSADADAVMLVSVMSSEKRRAVKELGERARAPSARTRVSWRGLASRFLAFYIDQL